MPINNKNDAIWNGEKKAFSYSLTNWQRIFNSPRFLALHFMSGPLMPLVGFFLYLFELVSFNHFFYFISMGVVGPIIAMKPLFIKKYINTIFIEQDMIRFGIDGTQYVISTIGVRVIKGILGTIEILNSNGVSIIISENAITFEELEDLMKQSRETRLRVSAINKQNNQERGLSNDPQRFTFKLTKWQRFVNPISSLYVIIGIVFVFPLCCFLLYFSNKGSIKDYFALLQIGVGLMAMFGASAIFMFKQKNLKHDIYINTISVEPGVIRCGFNSLEGSYPTPLIKVSKGLYGTTMLTTEAGNIILVSDNAITYQKLKDLIDLSCKSPK